jgi:antitoxin Phd
MSMLQTWKLPEAKNEFNRVIENAVNSGPQIITWRGVEVAVVLSYVEYKNMIAPGKKLSAFFRESPLAGSDLDLARDKGEAKKEAKRDTHNTP